MIGIFDSGSGGLTVLAELLKRVPRADVLYFGDIANVPYGTKTERELRALTIGAVDFLIKNGAWDLISACNSVSARTVLADHRIDRAILEMVEPTVEALANESGEILLDGTLATVRSGIYQQAFAKQGKKIHVLPIAPLAALVEAGVPGEQVAEVIKHALSAAPEADALVLGCTHFPLVRGQFQRFFAGRIVDPASYVAEKAVQKFETKGSGTLRFVITKDSEPFRRRVAELFGGLYSIDVI